MYCSPLIRNYNLSSCSISNSASFLRKVVTSRKNGAEEDPAAHRRLEENGNAGEAGWTREASRRNRFHDLYDPAGTTGSSLTYLESENRITSISFVAVPCTSGPFS